MKLEDTVAEVAGQGLEERDATSTKGKGHEAREVGGAVFRNHDRLDE